MAASAEWEWRYYFDCYGPFELEHTGGVFSGKKVAFKAAIERHEPGLASAIGCYLFGIRYGNHIRPWYAGMTVAKGGFIEEVLQQHKRDIFEESMQQQKGTPVMFLFPLLTAAEMRFSKARSSGRPVILWLERMLMSLAYARNPAIGNLRDMHFLRNVEVLGLLGPKRPGRPHREAKQIRRVLLGSK